MKMLLKMLLINCSDDRSCEKDSSSFEKWQLNHRTGDPPLHTVFEHRLRPLETWFTQDCVIASVQSSYNPVTAN